MERPPTTPADGGAEWGQRRQGTAPPHRPFAADEERLRTEWDSVNAAWARAREREHAEGRAAGDEPPPGAGPPPPAGVGGMPDLSALFVLLDTLRSAAPAELQERTTALIREVLLTLRSLIDWYLERLDRPRTKPEVEDIPLD